MKLPDKYREIIHLFTIRVGCKRDCKDNKAARGTVKAGFKARSLLYDMIGGEANG